MGNTGWPSAGLHSKIIRVRKKERSTCVLLFLNSFCTHVIDSEKFIDRSWYRKECYIHYGRDMMLEDVPASRTVRNPYDVNATSDQVPTRSSLSAGRWNWARHGGVGLYAWVSSYIRRRLARNGGCGSYTLKLGHTLELGCTHGSWAVHNGVWLEMEVVDRTRWLWVWDVGAGCTRRRFLHGTCGQREGMITAVKRGRRHTKYGHWCPPFPATA